MVWNLRLMTILFNVIFFIFFIQQDFPQNYEVNFCFRVGAVSEVRRQTIWYDMRANSNLRSGENFVRGDEGTSADTSHQLSLFPLCPTYEGLPGELTRPEWGQVGVGRTSGWSPRVNAFNDFDKSLRERFFVLRTQSVIHSEDFLTIRPTFCPVTWCRAESFADGEWHEENQGNTRHCPSH